MLRTFQYPWGQRVVNYDSFTYKLINMRTNEIIVEQEATTEEEHTSLVEMFYNQREIAEKNHYPIKDVHKHCFEYEVGDDKNRDRFLCFITGFLKVKWRQ